VGFARNAVIVDEKTIELMGHISDALKGLASALEQVEARLCLVEKAQDQKLIDQAMSELGFKAYER
jgi:hypothetical protein